MADKTPAGVARIVKTIRVPYTLTDADAAAFFVNVDCVWDNPFSDLDYTTDQNVEVLTPGNPGDYFVGGFSRDVTKVTVMVGFSGNAAAGAQIVVHAHAVRD